MKLSELLQVLIANNDSSVTELSRRADVNRSWVYRKLQGDDENLDSLFDILTPDVEPEELVIALRLIKYIKVNQQIL